MYNCAFPSTNFDGTKLVFRSSWTPVDGGDKEKLQHKNLFVMDAERGDIDGVARLTEGEFTDTHCSWSPVKGCDWIVFSSHRDKPPALKGVKDHGLDAGYFAVYLVNANDIKPNGPVPKPVRVIHSAGSIAGHVNHPVFSPDMASIVFAADLAAVSADPISLPHFTHSVRPYGDIFSINLVDKNDMAKNEDIKEFHRITHSRYEYSTPTWAGPADDDEDPNAKWKMLESVSDYQPVCPYARGQAREKEGWHMTGHLSIEKWCC
jgi:Tol biopolymer transport system component